MAIKSDRWIREMSEKHGMIEHYAVNSRFLQTYILQLSIQRILMTKVLSILSLMFVLFRQTHLP